MAAWDTLSIAQRSQLMNKMREYGIYSPSEMRRVYNEMHPQLETTAPQTAPMYAKGGDKATLDNPKYNSAHERAMYDRLRYKNLNNAQASGLLGNLSVESYLKADLKQKNGPAYGLMQAEGARQKAMKSYNYTYEFGSGLSPEEQKQLDYVINEGMYKDTPGEWRYGKGYKRAKDARQAFLNSDDVNKAALIIQNNYLRPGKPHTQRRQDMAEYYEDKYSQTFPYNMEEFEDGYLYNPHSEGGSIHIKPENRGKFTALKERTGHSASWFKAHGTPAQKKMAVFALNARKWKHAHGGVKF